MQWRAVFDGQLGNLRLPDGLDAEFEDRLVEALRQQAVNYFLANLRGITPHDDRLRHLARAEAGNLGILPVICGHIAKGFGDLFRGNVEHQFAGALRIESRAMRMVVVMGMVVPSLGSAVKGGLAGFRLGIVFESGGRTQRIAFRARSSEPNKVPERA